MTSYSTPACVRGGGDADYFRLDLAEGTTIAVRASGSVRDTKGAILDADGDVVADSDDAYLLLDPYQFALRATLAAGTYYIRVESFCSGRSYGLYFLHVDQADEPGSSRAEAAGLDMGQTAGGRTDADGDYFTFTLDESTRVALVGSSREADIEAALQDSDGSTLDVVNHQVNFWANGNISIFAIYGLLAPGTYFLEVDAQQSGDTGEYLVLWRRDASYERLEDICPSAPAGINDTLYGCQWHLENNGQFNGTPGEDININDAALGSVWDLTKGEGVNVVVVDTGLDHLHVDLADNVDRAKNCSFVNADRTGYVDCDGGDVFGTGETSHGTAVAGLIAARDNDIGMRGVAPRATIYAFDMLKYYSPPPRGWSGCEAPHYHVGVQQQLDTGRRARGRACEPVLGAGDRFGPD